MHINLRANVVGHKLFKEEKKIKNIKRQIHYVVFRNRKQMQRGLRKEKKKKLTHSQVYSHLCIHSEREGEYLTELTKNRVGVGFVEDLKQENLDNPSKNCPTIKRVKGSGASFSCEIPKEKKSERPK